MPSWTDLERSRLLLAMIELLVPPNKLPSWAEVAGKMGTGFTQEAVRQQYRKLRREGLQNTGSTSTPNTPQRTRERASQPTGAARSPIRRRRPRGKRGLVESDEDDEDDDDQKDGESKKIKREAEDRPRRILKTEPVDADFVVNLDDDELSPFEFPIYI